MDLVRHIENRNWAFGALDELEGFLDDDDFEGNAAEEQDKIGRNRRELREGKYRVVFLGAFNVGKSSLINALLGDDYLPTILEECTTKITHIVKGDAMKAVVRLTQPMAEDEADVLDQVLGACGVDALVEQGEDEPSFVITFTDSSPRALVKALNALVTLNATEDFPQLRTLREKFEEIIVHIPTELLAEDMAFIDLPGVHSVSETNQRIVDGLIPNSHLIVYLLESQSAGNQQSRAFVEELVRERDRKVFFVINKADQLHRDEIDPEGRRGPAKDLVRSLTGVIEDPEIFFVSSLYALCSNHLAAGRMDMDDLDDNNKIKIPMRVLRDLLQADDPNQAIAEYLGDQSRLDVLRGRLLDYLYKENREGAILQSVCRFLDATSWAYVRPMQVQLDMARDNPRLAELEGQHEALCRELDENKRRATEVLDDYNRMASGGTVDGKVFLGYEQLLEAKVNPEVIEERVKKPLQDWIRNGDNLKKAKRSGFDALTSQVEQTIDEYLLEVYGELREQVSGVESVVMGRMGSIRDGVDAAPGPFTQAMRGSVGSVRAGLFGSYFLFTLVGALVGAGLGEGVWAGLRASGQVDLGALLSTAVQTAGLAVNLGEGAVLFAAAGGVLGGVLGLLSRAATHGSALKGRLADVINRKTDQVLLKGVTGSEAEKASAVLEQMKACLGEHRKTFGEWAQAAFDTNMANLNGRISEVQGDIGQLKEKLEEIIARLEPKVEHLAGLRERAHAIVQESAAARTESSSEQS